MNQTPNPFMPFWDSYDNTQASPAYDNAHAYQDLLGRMPEYQPNSQLGPIHEAVGMDGIRRNILASNEYTARLLGSMPQSVSQDMGRRAAVGINSMPGVFSDYTNPNLPNQHHNMASQRAQAQQMMPDAFQALLGAFTAPPAQELPPAVQQLIAGPQEPAQAEQTEAVKGKKKSPTDIIVDDNFRWSRSR